MRWNVWLWKPNTSCNSIFCSIKGEGGERYSYLENGSIFFNRNRVNTTCRNPLWFMIRKVTNIIFHPFEVWECLYPNCIISNWNSWKVRLCSYSSSKHRFWKDKAQLSCKVDRFGLCTRKDWLICTKTWYMKYNSIYHTQANSNMYKD